MYQFSNNCWVNFEYFLFLKNKTCYLYLLSIYHLFDQYIFWGNIDILAGKPRYIQILFQYLIF